MAWTKECTNVRVDKDRFGAVGPTKKQGGKNCNRFLYCFFKMRRENPVGKMISTSNKIKGISFKKEKNKTKTKWGPHEDTGVRGLEGGEGQEQGYNKMDDRKHGAPKR